MSDSRGQINRTGHYRPYCEFSPACSKGPGDNYTCRNITAGNCQRNKELCEVDAPKHQDAHRPILKQRGQEYGDYTTMATAIQTIKNAIRDWNTKGLPATHMEALEMIATKIGRILTGNPNNEDSWRDIAGYATLVADRIPKPAAPGEGQIVEIPDGWRIDTSHGTPDRWLGPMKGDYWNGDIMSLRQHLGLS